MPATRTRIVATLGPASSTEASIAGLIEAGVDLFRLNFSHGTHEEHGALIASIRKCAGERPIAILQDLCGPKLRLPKPLRGKPGDIVELGLPPGVRAGEPVLLADGTMTLEVVDPRRARVIVGGDLPAGKGMNFPASNLAIPSLTDKDRDDLRFGVAHAVDFVALSFVRRASDLEEVKASGIPVIAKIEKGEALENLDAILAVSDGLMVARGDLGVEIPIERVPAAQKRVIALANRAGKPVITATQMLLSMVKNPLPTRAEATDVANAVLDGTDAVMLSEETAIGDHPADCVRMMDRILAETEPLLRTRDEEPGSSPDDVIAWAACEVAERIGARALIVPTASGFTARKVAARRPNIPIIALTPSDAVRRRLSIVWGVTALAAPWYGDTAAVLERFREPVRATGLVPAGAPVVVTAGWPFSRPGITNLVHVAQA